MASRIGWFLSLGVPIAASFVMPPPGALAHGAPAAEGRSRPRPWFLVPVLFLAAVGVVKLVWIPSSFR